MCCAVCNGHLEWEVSRGSAGSIELVGNGVPISSWDIRVAVGVEEICVALWEDANVLLAIDLEVMEAVIICVCRRLRECSSCSGLLRSRGGSGSSCGSCGSCGEGRVVDGTELPILADAECLAVGDVQLAGDELLEDNVQLLALSLLVELGCEGLDCGHHISIRRTRSRIELLEKSGNELVLGRLALERCTDFLCTLLLLFLLDRSRNTCENSDKLLENSRLLGASEFLECGDNKGGGIVIGHVLTLEELGCLLVGTAL